MQNDVKKIGQKGILQNGIQVPDKVFVFGRPGRSGYKSVNQYRTDAVNKNYP
jgi:hypothetical protein